MKQRSPVVLGLVLVAIVLAVTIGATVWMEHRDDAAHEQRMREAEERLRESREVTVDDFRTGPTIEERMKAEENLRRAEREAAAEAKRPPPADPEEE